MLPNTSKVLPGGALAGLLEVVAPCSGRPCSVSPFGTEHLAQGPTTHGGHFEMCWRPVGGGPEGGLHCRAGGLSPEKLRCLPEGAQSTWQRQDPHWWAHAPPGLLLSLPLSLLCFPPPGAASFSSWWFPGSPRLQLGTHLPPPRTWGPVPGGRGTGVLGSTLLPFPSRVSSAPAPTPPPHTLANDGRGMGGSKRNYIHTNI